MSFDNFFGYILSISMCMQNFITIFHSAHEIGPFSLFSEFGARQSLDQNKCHFTISSARSCQYQCVCKSVSKFSKRFKRYGHVSLFVPGQNRHKLSGEKKNQIFDYRALSESQPSASVDFLWIRQFLTLTLAFGLTAVDESVANYWICCRK